MQSRMLVSAACRAMTHALIGMEVEPAVVDAGARDKASAMTLSFPAIHFTSNGLSETFSRNLLILAFLICGNDLAKMPMSGR